MDLSSLGGGGGGGGGGKSESSSASSTSGNNFGGLADGNGLTATGALVIAAITIFGFLGLVVLAKK